MLPQIPSRHAETIEPLAATTESPIAKAPPALVTVRGFMQPATLDAETAFYTQFLDILHATQAIQTCHRRTRELLEIRDGYQLLDVGCGTGNFTREAAAHVGVTGRVIGVDLSPALIGVARQRSAHLDLPIAFHVADAHALPFADNTFDGCRVERVLQYVADPGRVLAEMVRVTRPGGCIVAAGVDWDTIVEDVPGVPRELYRRMIHRFSDSVGNGWMGREVRRRLLEINLDNVTCEGFVAIWTDALMVLDGIGRRRSMARIRDAGQITDAECDHLIAAVENAGTSAQYLAAFTLFLASGRKPITQM